MLGSSSNIQDKIDEDSSDDSDDDDDSSTDSDHGRRGRRSSRSAKGTRSRSPTLLGDEPEALSARKVIERRDSVAERQLIW